MELKTKTGRPRVTIPRYFDNGKGTFVPITDPSLSDTIILGDHAFAQELGVSQATVYLWRRIGALRSYSYEAGNNVYHLADAVKEIISSGQATFEL